MDKTIFVFNFELLPVNSPLIWLEHLASAVNGLTNSPKFLDQTKREVL